MPNPDVGVGVRCVCPAATDVLVETLLDRGADGDVVEAEAAIDRLARPPADGFMLRDVVLLRLRAARPRARRRDRLPRLSGSLPRNGESARLRRTYQVGRGDAMTTLGEAYRCVSEWTLRSTGQCISWARLLGR
jgi:hypothetical protein